MPALSYGNQNPVGAPCAKFDNFQMLPRSVVEVIDSKTAFPAAPSSSTVYWIAPALQTQLTSQSAAPTQNPGCVGATQVPNAAEATIAAGMLGPVDIVFSQLG